MILGFCISKLISPANQPLQLRDWAVTVDDALLPTSNHLHTISQLFPVSYDCPVVLRGVCLANHPESRVWQTILSHMIRHTPRRMGMAHHHRSGVTVKSSLELYDWPIIPILSNPANHP